MPIGGSNAIALPDGSEATKVALYDAAGNPLLPAAAALNGTWPKTTAAAVQGAAVMGNDGTNLVLVDLSASGSDAQSNSVNALRASARLNVFNGTTWDRLRGDTHGLYAQLRDAADSPLLPAVAAPAAATPYGSLTKLMALQMLDNGATLDMAHGAKEITVLASAARTSTQTSADYLNTSCRGVRIYLNVTAASGTGGLQIQIQGKDPVSGVYTSYHAAVTAVTATGMKNYALYPSAISGGVTLAFNQVLDRTFRIVVTHGDSSGYTYSVGMVLLP